MRAMENQPSILHRVGLTLGATILASTMTSSEVDSRHEPNRIEFASLDNTPDRSTVVTDGYNVITIMTDDMNDVSCEDTKKYFPKSGKQLLKGTCYENARVASPVCCPSRAAYATGQLPHNNRVRTIQDGNKLTVADTIEYRLRESGIVTYGVGKPLNGVKMKKLANPDFDTGFTEHDFWKPHRYRDYEVIGEDGKIEKPKPMIHTSVYTGNLLNGFVEDMLSQDNQFYAYGSFVAPHSQHATNYTKNLLPRSTQANRHKHVPPFEYNPEANTDDKLRVFQMSSRSREYYEKVNAARVRSLYDVDQQINRLFQTLRKYNALDDTVVFVTSDNGYQLGENNWEFKGTPYASSLDVPLLAYYPDSVKSRPRVSAKVNLLDLAPTIYDLAGVEPTTQLDGYSLLSGYKRKAEFYEIANLRSGDETGEGGKIPSWSEYILNGKAYIQYHTQRGKVLREEFYEDKGYKRNLLHPMFKDQAPSRATLKRFRQLLKMAKTCAGTTKTSAPNPCP